MATITFNKFDLGIDLRKSAAVSDANRLREMKNAYVTTGLATAKRPGFTKVATLEAGTKGLASALGKLHTFYGGAQEITHAYPLFQANRLVCAEETTDDENSETSFSAVHEAVTDVHYVDVFNGYLYVAAQHGDLCRHHYLGDGEITQVTDANCPHTRAVVKTASKIFAISPDGATVRYSKTGDPAVWTETDDAGFLPTGLNALGSRNANALGLYRGNLVVLMRDGAQVWAVDPDPTAMSLAETVENVGSSYPQSLATVAGDLYFLSDFGFRSITTQQLVARLDDLDIGSPIDDLVRPVLKGLQGTPRAVYFYGTGQYLCAIDRQMFVYSVSRTSKIAAWSRYELPFPVDAMDELDGVLYLRSGDDVYKLDENAHTDDGTPYEVMLELPYMNFKSPGVLKRVYGVDLVMQGECFFSMGFDVRNTDAVTSEVRVVGNTYGGGLIPLEVAGTEFSPRFRNVTGEAFQLDALTVYYETLGVL